VLHLNDHLPLVSIQVIPLLALPRHERNRQQREQATEERNKEMQQLDSRPPGERDLNGDRHLEVVHVHEERSVAFVPEAGVAERVAFTNTCTVHLGEHDCLRGVSTEVKVKIAALIVIAKRG